MNQNKNNMGKINDGHYLELCDRLHVINCMIEEHILKHPLLDTESNIPMPLALLTARKIVVDASKSLGEAYQIVGEKL